MCPATSHLLAVSNPCTMGLCSTTARFASTLAVLLNLMVPCLPDAGSSSHARQSSPLHEHDRPAAGVLSVSGEPRWGCSQNTFRLWSVTFLCTYLCQQLILLQRCSHTKPLFAVALRSEAAAASQQGALSELIMQNSVGRHGLGSSCQRWGLLKMNPHSRS